MAAPCWSSPRAQQIDAAKLRDLLGLEIGRAAAAFVRNTIGFTIGGVPTAAGHATRPIVVIDRDLRQFASVWAAAGTPDAVFRLIPDDPVGMTGGRIADNR